MFRTENTNGTNKTHFKEHTPIVRANISTLKSPCYQSFKTYFVKQRKRFVIKIMLTQGPLTSTQSSQSISERRTVLISLAPI